MNDDKLANAQPHPINHEKLVKMESAGVSDAQIMAVFALSESDYANIKLSDEYNKAKAEVVSDEWERDDNIDNGWDMAEAAGLNVALAYAQTTNDPEFGLKLAVVANKAKRNSREKNRPIVASHGLTAVIALQPTFVNALAQNFTVEKHDISATVEKKQVNMLTPKGVQILLSPKRDTSEAMFVDMPELVPASV